MLVFLFFFLLLGDESGCYGLSGEVVNDLGWVLVGFIGLIVLVILLLRLEACSYFWPTAVSSASGSVALVLASSVTCLSLPCSSDSGSWAFYCSSTFGWVESYGSTTASVTAFASSTLSSAFLMVSAATAVASSAFSTAAVAASSDLS